MPDFLLWEYTSLKKSRPAVKWQAEFRPRSHRRLPVRRADRDRPVRVMSFARNIQTVSGSVLDIICKYDGRASIFIMAPVKNRKK